MPINFKPKLFKIKNSDGEYEQLNYLIAENNLNQQINNIKNIAADTVEDWLDNHPEATTTVDFRVTNKVFNSVAQMVADATLINNAKVKTQGFYSAGDGGGATYIITDNAVADGIFVHELGNGLFASYINDSNIITIESLGGLPLESGYEIDISPLILAYINYIDSDVSYPVLKLGIGTYKCSETLITKNSGFAICGESSMSASRNGTRLTVASDNQDYIIQIGDATHQVMNCKLSDIMFTTLQSFENVSASTPVMNVGYLLRLQYCANSIFNRLSFFGFIGGALYFNSTWELQFDTITVSWAGGFNTPKIYFDTPSTGNISALSIGNIYIETVNGIPIWIEASSYNNSIINNIFYEDRFIGYDGGSGQIYNSSDVVTDELSIIHISNGAAIVTIKEINAQNLGMYVRQIDDKLYRVAKLISGTLGTVIVNNIVNQTGYARPKIIQSERSNRCRININNIYNIEPDIFDLSGAKFVSVNNFANAIKTSQNLIELYKYVYDDTANSNFPIVSDSDAITDVQLAVTRQSSTGNSPYLSIFKVPTSGDLWIRAKKTSTGTTVMVYVDGTQKSSVTISSANYAWYRLGHFDGKEIMIGGSTGIVCDVAYFKPDDIFDVGTLHFKGKTSNSGLSITVGAGLLFLYYGISNSAGYAVINIGSNGSLKVTSTSSAIETGASYDSTTGVLTIPTPVGGYVNYNVLSNATFTL